MIARPTPCGHHFYGVRHVQEMDLCSSSEIELSVSLQLPLDLTKLSPEERALRLAKRRPKKKIVIEEEIEETFDRNKYSHLWKRK